MSPTLTIASLAFASLFFLGRRLAWWYFGIDRMVRALENIDASLRTLPSVERYDNETDRRPPRAA